MLTVFVPVFYYSSSRFMYTSQKFQIRDEETFSLCIPTDRDYKILQLTDLHLGFGMFSGKKDRLALAAVTELIRRTKGKSLFVPNLKFLRSIHRNLFSVT